jgi:hypothetical protein
MGLWDAGRSISGAASGRTVGTGSLDGGQMSGAGCGDITSNVYSVGTVLRIAVLLWLQHHQAYNKGCPIWKTIT